VAACIGGEALQRSTVSSYGIREEGKRSDVTQLKRGDLSMALTMKGAEVVAEIRNLARGMELRCRGVDEQCLGMEGEVATCLAVDERCAEGLAAERHDGGRWLLTGRWENGWEGGLAGRMVKWRRRGGGSNR
jgi:hypothetical protein